MRGRFIVLEGIDGSGSTTQSKRLCEHLSAKGRECFFTAEPSKGPMGEIIRKFLKDQSEKPQLFYHILALSFATDRLCHYEQEILPKLKAGIDVVSDRYVLSSLVYQGLDLPQSWVKELNRYAPNPDLTILIDTPEAIACKRRMQRGEEAEIFEETQLQAKLRERYLALAFTAMAVIIDGSGDIDNVFEEVKKTISDTVGD